MRRPLRTVRTLRRSPPLRHLGLLLVALAWGLGTAAEASDRTARPLGTDPSSCDGIANYADELVPSEYRLVRQTEIEDDLTEVEIAFDLRKRVAVPFRSASALPHLASFAEGGVHADLGVRLESLLPAEFPEIRTRESAVSSSETLVLRLPTENVPELRRRLIAGRIPMTVHADEMRRLQRGVHLEAWTTGMVDRFLEVALLRPGNAQAMEARPPYVADAEYVIELPGGSEDDPFFSTISPTPSTPTYLIPGVDSLRDLPESIHYVRVIEALFDPTYAPTTHNTAWLIRVRRTDLESIPEIYTNGSFCTPRSNHVDWPVQATRLHAIDGDLRDEAERDRFIQPIRFNQIPFADGAVTLSGQVQGHVLKPTLEIRVRPGGVRAVVDFDTDLSLSAELRAQATQSVGDRFPLYSLCFPMARFPAGPIGIGLNLQLEHDLQVDGSVGAGTVVGFQKRFQGGFTLGYDSRRPAAPWFAEPRHAEPHPVEFTPPQLTDDTAAHIRVDSNARVTLRVGGEYPVCDTGFGAYMDARAFGTLDVTPTEEVWWQVGHGAELTAGMDIQAYGLEIVGREADPFLVLGQDVRGAEPAPPATAAGVAARVTASESTRHEGADQRWAVGIDSLELLGGINATSLAELSDGGIAVVYRDANTRGHLLKLDHFGQLQWRREYAGTLGNAPRRLVVLPDDSIVVVGESGWLARHDAEGDLLWAARYDVRPASNSIAWCSPIDLVYVEDEGAPGLVLVGSTTVDQEPDGCAYRVDLDGGAVWARTYEHTGNQELLAATPVVVRDGAGHAIRRIAAVGRTSNGPDPFHRNNPLVVMIEPDDGRLVWALLLNDYARWGFFEGIVQGAGGTLYMAGTSRRTIRQNGSALVARIEPDGTDARAALLLHDEGWEHLLDFEEFEETQGGDSGIDIFRAIATAPGGIVVVGSTDGLATGDPSAVWVARLNPNLGVEWFTTVDGVDHDVLDSIVHTRDGYLAAGWSDSLAGVGQQAGDRWLTVMKLPFEGRIAFAPEANLVSRYVEPGIRFVGYQPALAPGEIEAVAEPLTAVEATMTVTPVTDPLVAPRDLCVTPIAGRHAGDAPACTTAPVGEAVEGAAAHLLDAPGVFAFGRM